MAQICIWIVLLPLLAFVVQTFVGKRLPRQGDWVSILAILASLVLTIPIFATLLKNGEVSDTLSAVWIQLPYPVSETFMALHPGMDSPLFQLRVGVLLNNVTAIMLLMVTLSASAIHLFSSGYMKGEDGYHRFFAFVSLFTASMLGLVVSDNLLLLFIFWELMGLCSYVLIGFYYKKPSANVASLKAFMTTRIGDAGLLLAIVGLFYVFGTVHFQEIYAALQAGQAEGKEILGMPALTFIGLMLLLAAIGKSAQFPLHVWLPDAMEGPTPVSALIHAATMVAAGVFLLIRMFPLLEASHTVLVYTAYVGAITAFFASLIALVQNDIKRVLAYSTVSQLGYMVMAVGVGAFSAALLHLVTHAFFKACLFLCSGSVIHSIHTQDMREMGGLRKKMPWTFGSMFVATLAISGVPFFSGFVSKDKILAGALGYGAEHQLHLLIPVLGFAAAAVTAFYMFRLIYMTFFGPAQDEHKFEHAHEQPWNMVVPLVVLAGCSLALWYSGLSGIHALDKFFAVHWYGDAVGVAQQHMGIALHEGGHGIHNLALVLSLILAGSGIALSSAFYLKKVFSPAKVRARCEPLYQLLVHKYFFDELYIDIIIKRIYLPLTRLIATFDDWVIDRILVDGWRDLTFAVKSFVGKFDDVFIDRIAVDGTAHTMAAGGWVLRRIQTGRVQHYLILSFLVMGITWLVLFG